MIRGAARKHEPDMNTGQRFELLHQLLCRRFGTRERLRQWVWAGPEGDKLVTQFPGGSASDSQFFAGAIEVMHAYGHIDRTFFVRMTREFGDLPDIVEVAAAWGIELAANAAVELGGPAPSAGARPGRPSAAVDGNVAFHRIEPTDLREVAVVAQSLDNQWVPRRLLAEMFASGLCLEDVRPRREQAVRSEYVRALVNAEQVVVNRAFIPNNPMISCDFVRPGDSREAFKALLADGVLIPYLYDETSPIVEPQYAIDPRGFSAWKEVCQEVAPHCVRFSWHAQTNALAIRDRFAGRFRDFMSTAQNREPTVYARSLDIPSDRLKDFHARLREVARHCQEGDGSRNSFYRRFIVVDDDKVDQGRYDPTKPFASELKQLFDLNYNVNLPDALGRYALTPFDSLPRSALQEWRPEARQAPLTIDRLKQFLQRGAFDLVQRSLFLDSFARLSLGDVRALRGTDEWSGYIESVQALLKDPWSFSESGTGASRVYDRFVAMARRMTRMKAGGEAIHCEPWEPVIELDIDIGGGIVSVQWATGGASYRVKGRPSQGFSPDNVPVSATLNIRDVDGASAQADLATDVVFLRGILKNAHAEFEELARHLGEQYRMQTPSEWDDDQQATINLPEYP